MNLKKILFSRSTVQSNEGISPLEKKSITQDLDTLNTKLFDRGKYFQPQNPLGDAGIQKIIDDIARARNSPDSLFFESKTKEPISLEVRSSNFLQKEKIPPFWSRPVFLKTSVLQKLQRFVHQKKSRFVGMCSNITWGVPVKNFLRINLSGLKHQSFFRNIHENKR